MLDLHIQLHRTNELLERIAVVLERAVGPGIDTSPTTKRGPESLVRYGDDEKSWKTENFQNAIHPLGLAPAAEQELLDKLLAEDEGQLPTT